jgi:hypothetical protein
LVSDSSAGAVAIVCPGSHSVSSIDIPSSPWFGGGSELANFLPERRIRRQAALRDETRCYDLAVKTPNVAPF